MSIGGTVVFNDVNLYGAAMNSVMRKALKIAAETTVEKAKQAIETGPKTGRVYTSGPQPLPHQASAAGQAPANWTGELAQSIKVTESTPVRSVVEVGAAYGAALELGTSKMGPRPFLTPAAAEGAAAAGVYVAGVAAKLKAPGREVPRA